MHSIVNYGVYDDVITRKMIKKLFNRECSELERKLFALPVKGGVYLLEVLFYFAKYMHLTCSMYKKHYREV